MCKGTRIPEQQMTLIKKKKYFLIQSTPYVKWTNEYAQFFIDWLVEVVFLFEHYTIHMAALVFYIGLTYVGAMKTDLKMQLQEIYENLKKSQ